MKYLSVCSGIEAASVAWHPLGWEPLAFSEIEPFPRAVLAHHYPTVALHGDFTVLRDEPWIVDADILVGGTPCQAFSVAGLRNSLADERGNLSLEFVRLADAIDNIRVARGRDHAVIVWENVPGVLSVKDNAFGCFLAGLAGDVAPYVPPRGKWTNAGVVAGPARAVAWRVLDAQYFGLAQRRRRVFVVASARDGFDPAAVLLEFEGMRRNTPPRRKTPEAASPGPSGRAGERSHWDGIEHPQDTFVTHSLRADGFDATTQFGDIAGSLTARHDSSPCADRGMNVIGFHPTQDPISSMDGSTHALGCGSKGGQASVAVAFGGAVARTLSARHDSSPCVDRGMDVVATSMAVRRLTPTECERLQGFPDNYTAIPWKRKPADQCPDGPRYKALGNSMAVPCMAWIGRRIAEQVK